MRGADLRKADLNGLPLARLRGGLTRDEGLHAGPPEWEMAAAHLEGAEFWGGTREGAHLEEAALRAAHLKGARLRDARLEQAYLYWADLEGVNLWGGHLERADLESAHLEGAYLYEAHLERADLRGAFFDTAADLGGAVLGTKDDGYVFVADVRWGSVNLAVVKWSADAPTRQRNRLAGVVLGDEWLARRPRDKQGNPKTPAQRLAQYEAAARANRQLATALQDQGLTEEAAYFAYRAQVLQRVVLKRQTEWLRWAGSLLLGLIAGYGYRPLRSFATYLLVVGAFALVYLVLGGVHGQSLSWNAALVVSLTAFHGRGFFATAFQPGDPQAAVAAAEAVFGLLIEITFIATFTQRFFAR